ncbi:MAG: hypothetical protein QW182_07575, partial [Thermosphaera sp.]
DIDIPMGWVILSHDTSEGKIELGGTGGYLVTPNTVVRIKIVLNVTVYMSEYRYINLTVKDTNEVVYENYLQVLIDTVRPRFVNLKINNEQYVQNMVVNGGEVNITGMVTDDGTSSGLKPQSLIVNDTRFVVQKFNVTDGTFVIKSVQTITGLVTLRLSVWDNADNRADYTIRFIGDVDAPIINEVVVTYGNNIAPLVGNTFWIPGSGNYNIHIKVNVSDISFKTSDSYLIINNTDIKYFDPVDSYFIASTVVPMIDADWFSINITASDTFGHVTTAYYVVRRDKFAPFHPVYEYVGRIGSGLQIKGLNAEDIGAGVKGFKIYVNGTNTLTIDLTDVITPGETFWDDVISAYKNKGFVFINDMILLNLENYRGQYVNITVRAIDWAGNEGDATVLFAGKLPETYWYPVPLYPGWNLITVPLVSVNITDIVNTEFTIFMYNSTSQQWIVLNSLQEMKAGSGYWYYSKGFSILIVEGYSQSLPGQLPVHFYLERGWNVIGIFGRGENIVVSEYLGSLQEKSYYPILFGWNPYSQTWRIIDARSNETVRYGEAVYIYMYTQQVLIPPSAQ